MDQTLICLFFLWWCGGAKTEDHGFSRLLHGHFKKIRQQYKKPEGFHNATLGHQTKQNKITSQCHCGAGKWSHLMEFLNFIPLKEFVISILFNSVTDKIQNSSYCWLFLRLLTLDYKTNTQGKTFSNNEETHRAVIVYSLEILSQMLAFPRAFCL